uniref:E3 ubiquitin-protein ligase n=1 Tax=Marseillevirus LCMAC201 TaxID=2506605 RepID=A0A481YWQ6_9VIRU|nr:MAG: E3 ubiquitin-protein ligase [Marseillevirus LCMAC201]
MTDDCLICFCPIEGSFVTCGEPFCIAKVCTDCAQLLISYSETSELIPQCPSAKCKGYYLLSEIKSLNKETVCSYYRACFGGIIKDKGTIAKKANEYQDILEKLRKEREHFLTTNFPLAISTVAIIAFPGKLRRVEKQHGTSVAEKINASNKACMNLTCNGHLDKDLVCMVCETEFCKECERILEENHQCKEEDAESVKLISTLVKCPNCGIAIQRSEGCDSMTCASCDTKFHYSTGETGGGGAHNNKIQINEPTKLSTVFKDVITNPKILALLLEFEAQKPPMASEKGVLSTLQKMYRNKNMTDSAAKSLTCSFNNFLKRKYAMKRYQSISASLEKAFRENKVTVKLLREACTFPT